MVVDMRARRDGGAVARAPPPALNSVRPKLFRRASLTSWGKNNLGMTRAAAINFKELLLTVQQQKYEDRDKAAQREISRNVSWEDGQSIRNRDERRSRLLLRSTARRDFLENWEREGRAKWNANQAALCRYERRLLNYELAVKATARARQRISRTRHTHDQAGGIRWFEKNLDRLGLDPGGGSSGGGGGGGGAGGGTLLPDKETTATFRSRLVRAVLDQNFVPSSNAEVMAELRFRGITGRRGRQEREHRRVKTEVDQRRAKAETDAQCSEEQHLKRMLDEGRERRELAAAHWVERHDLEEKQKSDKKRFAEMAAAHDDAFEAAFNNRARRARDSYEAGGAEREAENDARRARLGKNREDKRRRVEVMCSQVVQKMVDLAMVASEVRTSQGGAPLPPTTWSHLKRWFCSPEPFFIDASPPEPSPEPSDPALNARTTLESQNLDRYEGAWRLRGGLPPELTAGPSPLSRALGVARELVEASGSGPREAPTYGRNRVGDGGDREVSVRLVVLGRREGLGDLCAELGRWTQLYVCSLDTALECAIELGAEAAASDGKGGKGQKGRKNSVGGDTGESSEVADALRASEKAKEAMFQRCFHPDAREEDVEAFKAAAVAYHALRTHPKKASVPVPLVTTTDLLVKHLSCRAPGGRGWVIMGYPNSLLESKLLENALSCYTDDEVAAELGTGGKPSKASGKTRKGSVLPQQEEEPTAPSRSGLDAVLNLPGLRSAATKREKNRPAESSEGTKGGGEEEGDPSDDLAAPEATEDDGGTDQNKDGNQSDERDAITKWWKGFEGGNLSCDVPNEANDERLLETLFLLVNAAQNRKDDYEVWLEDKASQKTLEDEAAQALEGGSASDPDGGGTTTRPASAEAVDRPSPLEVPLTALLENLRRERRASMSHSTRIKVEAMTGDRELDVEGVQAAISHAGATAAVSVGEGAASTASSPLRELEAECPAASVVGWATLALFSFCRELRAPDDRWTTACIRLEEQISAWLARRSEALAAASNSRGRDGRAKRLSSGDPSATALAIPPIAEEDPIWEALEAFQLETGDVVDDRHCSAEAIMREVDAESDRKINSWIRDVERAAAELCARERVSYRETVQALRTLDCLFGLEQDRSDGTADQIRDATSAAVEALTKGLPTTSGGRAVVIDGGCLEKEVRQAVQEVCQHNEQLSSSQEPLHELAPSLVGSGHKEGNLLPQGYTDEDGSSSMERSNDRAKAHCESTSLAAAPSLHTNSGDGERNKESAALNTAIWRCRLTYICRLRGVILRLVRAVGQCEARVSSMRAALRRLKRRRVQLEHNGFSVAASTVRRALEECDHATIADMLDNGIPVWIEDDETFAADPNVALPWGMSGLGLTHITDLARTLRDSLARADGEARGTMMPKSELSRALRAWSNSDGTTIRCEGGKEELPRAWTIANTGYIDKLCEAMVWDQNTGEVPWRRLVHALLLGHVRSLPTLEHLRLMRNAFSLKASTASRTSTGEAIKRTSTTERVESTKNIAQTASSPSAIQVPTLRIAQRHLTGVPWWFEQQENEAGPGAEHEGTASWSSALRAVYTEAWGGDDGRVDGMDLLLTLCAVPDDGAGAFVAREEDEEDDRDSGIPFSPGLFRAFSMLADTASSTNDTPVTTSQVLSGMVTTTEAVPSSSAGDPQGSDIASNPRVSLPHLRAILEHGGGMPTADVLDVCHLVGEEEVSRIQGEMERQKVEERAKEASFVASAGAVSVRDEPATPLEPHEKDDAAGEGVDAAAPTPDVLQVETADDHVAAGENVETPTDRAAGEDDRAGEGNLLKKELPALTISFATVSECKAVRAWVRRGAYTLPAFNVTSGRQDM